MNDDDALADTISHAKQGDREALNVLLGMYRPDIRGWVEHECGKQAAGHVDVSGVTQDALFYVHQHIAAFRGSNPQQFRSWIKRISLNRLIDEIRKNGAQKRNRVGVRSLDTPDNLSSGMDLDGGQSTPSVQAVRNEQLM